METKDKILIVEDDETIAAFLIAVLEANGFDTIRASLGREAVTLISSHCPDLVLLDLSLPDMDGMEILAGLRKWSTLPVIVVSARGRERDKVIALDMGADDYLTKPFGPGELLARIRAALRHVRTAAGGEVGRTGVYRCGDLEVDCVRRRVRINGEDIHLTQSEYRILSLLTRHAGKVLTYDFILRELWGPSAGGSNQILRVNVANIRRKIEKNPAEPKYIFTEIATKNPAFTTVCVLTDKEEIGSDGVTGMQSMYVFHFMQELCRTAGQDDIIAFRNSVCLSADVTAAYDPSWASAFEPMNGTYAGRGIALFKYTGSRGKSAANDASAELVGYVTRMMDADDVAWQIGELGRLDLGGGGTIAKYVANRGIPVIDIGVPVLSMHSPFEVIHKTDLYMAYRAFVLFNQAAE